MTRPSDIIGEVRKAWDLKRGDHVRLADGRWALLNADPSMGLMAPGSGRVGATVVINMTRSEWVTWRADEHVFSRTPEEHMRSVEEAFADLKVDALAATVTRHVVNAPRKPKEPARHFKAGDRVRFVDASDPDLNGATGYVLPQRPTGPYDVMIAVEIAGFAGEKCPCRSSELELVAEVSDER